MLMSKCTDRFRKLLEHLRIFSMSSNQHPVLFRWETVKSHWRKFGDILSGIFGVFLLNPVTFVFQTLKKSLFHSYQAMVHYLQMVMVPFQVNLLLHHQVFSLMLLLYHQNFYMPINK